MHVYFPAPRVHSTGRDHIWTCFFSCRCIYSALCSTLREMRYKRETKQSNNHSQNLFYVCCFVCWQRPDSVAVWFQCACSIVHSDGCRLEHGVGILGTLGILKPGFLPKTEGILEKLQRLGWCAEVTVVAYIHLASAELQGEARTSPDMEMGQKLWTYQGE